MTLPLPNPAAPQAPPRRPSLLPAEHGAWAFLLLPTLSALALRPSLAGLALFGMGLSAFLGRVPFRRMVRSKSATGFDRRWLLAYLLAGAAGFVIADWRAGLWPLAVLLPALPLGAWILRVDLAGGARSHWAEWAIIAMPCFLGAAMVRAGHGSWLLALALGGGAFLSLAAPLTYLRARLALRRGGKGGLAAALGVHGVAFLGALALHRALAVPSLLGWLWPAWMGLLLLRALLEPRIEPAVPDPRALGFRESLVCAVSSLALVVSIHGV